MTYTFKLSRRLAISRVSVKLSVFVLLAACAGDTTGPEGVPTSTPTSPTAFRVVPSAVTIETNQSIRFRAESRAHSRRDVLPMVWEASGGTIKPDGTFSSASSGTFKVVGRGRGRQRPDTSVVVVVPPQPDLVAIEVTPEAVALPTGGTGSFTAVGRLSDGTTTPVGVNWSSTGGTIDPAGAYQAGTAAGTYRVVATNTAGTLADTAAVTIEAAQSPPAPDPTLTSVVLKPASVTLVIGGSKRFSAYGRSGTGDSVAVADVAFTATGGSITPDGFYTAGPTPGTFQVVASSHGLSDTSLVMLTVPSTTAGTGIPIGLSGILANGVNPAPYTMSLDGYTASNIVSRIAEARDKKIRIMMNMTGGAHSNYQTDGVFDLAKWRAKMDTYNTATIKTAVAAAVADGIIVGNSVMDEPHNSTEHAGWGGNVTKAMVDGMCGYVKAIFPTLAVGVVHDHRHFEPEKDYSVCDFVLSQYRESKGPVAAFRDGGVAFAKRSGIAIAFSLNVLHGGTRAEDCPKYGYDLSGLLCPMTPEQIRTYGLTLGPAGCALNMWRYESAYFYDSANREAVRAVADSLARLPRKPCSRA